MKSCSVDGIFSDEEDLFLLGIESTVNESVSERFDVLLLFIFEKSLIDDFFGHLFWMNDVKNNIGMFWWVCRKVDIKVLWGLF